MHPTGSASSDRGAAWEGGRCAPFSIPRLLLLDAVENDRQIGNMAPRAISPGEIAEERMPSSFSKATRTAEKWAVVLAVVATAGIAHISAVHADEANAKSLLKAMSDYLAAQEAISFDYDSNHCCPVNKRTNPIG